MTTWSAPVMLGQRSVSRRQSRRMSRRFEAVGVGIAPERIRAIAMGRPATEDELVDVSFALTVTELLNEKRRSRRGRARRRCTHSLMVIAGIVVAINMLLCMGLVLFILTQHTSPY
ncbi:hypothetical protein [Candidatus Mycolicibacterium alkanivorans]|uniref:Uncharacterized protein n=1 Tax=Candidatus Mycolicibacterium alkanivorans TaxID=2954114 RepID=A0ABS9YWZ7_9MYCO|nr:hypothetical protein [Candidatus Mycolicibacterium alkanivorans]MCI4675777.1 hypothetical protein [Candidatus Mycolicibacterium alkanivorans]